MGLSKESRLCGSRAGHLEHLIFYQRCILNVRSPSVSQPPSQGLLTIAYYLHSFDHLIRSRQHIRRNRQTDLLGRFQIDDELELLWLLDWQVSRFGTLEDFIHVRGGATVQVENVHAVKHQSPGFRKLAIVINAGEPFFAASSTICAR